MNEERKYNTCTLVLLRHGESQWNKENLFSGWTDVDLSDRGRAEASEAAHALVRYLDKVSDDAIAQLNIPTGNPFVDKLDEKLDPIRHNYLEN